MHALKYKQLSRVAPAGCGGWSWQLLLVQCAFPTDQLWDQYILGGLLGVVFLLFLWRPGTLALEYLSALRLSFFLFVTGPPWLGG